MKFFIKRYLRNLIKIYLVLFLAVIIILSGCSEDNQQMEEENSNNINENTISNDCITFFNSDFSYKKVKNINNLMDEAGFNIQFSNIKFDQSGMSYRKVGNFIKNKIDEGNQIAFLSSEFTYGDSDSITIEKLKASGYLIEISDLYKQYAPNYYMNTFNNENFCRYYFSDKCKNVHGSKIKSVSDNAEEIYSIPIGEDNRLTDGIMAVLVKKEIMDIYGNDTFKTIEDYQELLNYIKHNISLYKPGLFIIKSDKTLFEYYPIQFMTEAEGYIPSDLTLGINRRHYIMYNFFYMDSVKLLNADYKGIDIIQASQLTFFNSFILTYREWADNGLMEFRNAANYNEIPDLNKYATIVIDTNMFTNLFITPEINAYEYNIYIINSEKCKVSGDMFDKKYFTDEILISRNCNNASEILRFIEWLYEDQNNYERFIYGVKDVDYNINENGSITVNDLNDYYNTALLSFKRSDMHIILSYYPYNWKECCNSLLETEKTITLDQLSKNINVMESYNNYMPKTEGDNNHSSQGYDYYNAAIKLYDNFFNDLLVEKKPNPEQIIDTFINETSFNSNLSIIKKVYENILFKDLLSAIKQ